MERLSWIIQVDSGWLEEPYERDPEGSESEGRALWCWRRDRGHVLLRDRWKPRIPVASGSWQLHEEFPSGKYLPGMLPLLIYFCVLRFCCPLMNRCLISLLNRMPRRCGKHVIPFQSFIRHNQHARNVGEEESRPPHHPL